MNDETLRPNGSSRRSFLRALGATAMLPGMLSGRTHAHMWQAPTGTQRKLVLINLQGGYDALSLLHPSSSAGGAAGQAFNAYRTQRPVLHWDAGRDPTLPFSGNPDLRWHPACEVLRREHANGDLVAVRKTGVPVFQQSHFKARNIMSLGRADLGVSPDRRGWLGRLSDVGLSNRFDILGVGTSARPDFIANGTDPLVLRSLDTYRARTFDSVPEQEFRRSILRDIVAQTLPGQGSALDLLRERTPIANDAALDLETLTATVPVGSGYPLDRGDPFGHSLRDIAKLIGGSVGTRIFYTISDGFDTHGGQEGFVQSITRPNLTQRLQFTMQALDAFITDLKSPAINAWNDTVILIFTEFGRRNFENDTRGTDHGRGFDAYLLGGGVRGALNAGLRGNDVVAADIQQDNLPVEIDFRTVFRKVLLEWLQLPAASVQSVFNDYSPLPGEPAFSLT